MFYAKRGLFTDKLGKYFSWLSPNQWTALSLVASLVAFYFLASGNFFFAGLSMVLTGFLDIVDGAVARTTKKASAKGAYIDTIADRYTESILILGLLFADIPSFFLADYVWIFLFFMGSLMTTYAKAAFKEKTGKDMSGGLLERAERLILLIAGVFLASINAVYLAYVIILLAVLTNVSALQRIYKGMCSWK